MRIVVRDAEWLVKHVGAVHHEGGRIFTEDFFPAVSEPASRQKITQSPETKQTLLLKALFNRGFFLAPRWVHMI